MSYLGGWLFFVSSKHYVLSRCGGSSLEGGCVMSCLRGWLLFVLSRLVAASCLLLALALSYLSVVSVGAAALIHLGGLLRLYLVSAGCSCIVSLLVPLFVSDVGCDFKSV
jgi:hypothetical protein